MKAAVIIPCYNEESTIEYVIKDYKQYFNNIYVIDNNCTDNTSIIAKRNNAIIIPEHIQGILRRGQLTQQGHTPEIPQTDGH